MTDLDFSAFHLETFGLPDRTILDERGQPSVQVLERTLGFNRENRRHWASHGIDHLRLYCDRKARAAGFCVQAYHYRKTRGPILLKGDQAASWETQVFQQFLPNWHLAKADDISGAQYAALRNDERERLSIWFSAYVGPEGKADLLLCVAQVRLALLTALGEWADCDKDRKSLLADVAFGLFTLFGPECLKELVESEPELVSHYGYVQSRGEKATGARGNIEGDKNCFVEGASFADGAQFTTGSESLSTFYLQLASLAADGTANPRDLSIADRVEVLITTYLPRLRKQLSLTEVEVRQLVNDFVSFIFGIGEGLQLTDFKDPEFTRVFSETWIVHINHQSERETALDYFSAQVIVYGLIAHNRTTGSFTAAQAKSIAEGWLPDAFKHLMEKQFEAFLDELVGLGVLRLDPSEGRNEYSLRSVNILNLVGSPREIDDKLLRAIADIVIDDPLSGHAFPKDAPCPSPLTLRDEKQLISMDSSGAREVGDRSSMYSVGIITGSEALGLDVAKFDATLPSIGEFESSRAQGAAPLYIVRHFEDTDLPRSTNFRSRLEAAISTLSKSNPIMLIVIVDGGMPLTHTLDMVDIAHELSAQATNLVHRVRVLFLLGPKALWQWEESAALTRERESAIFSELFEDADQVLPYRVQIRGRLRPTPASFGAAQDTYLLEIYLENDLMTAEARPFGIEVPFLLDVRFTARLTAGTQHLVPHRLQPEDYRYLDEDGLPGYGITCSVRALPFTQDAFQTDSFPTTAQLRVEAPQPEDVDMAARPSYRELAKGPVPVLESFLSALKAYGHAWEKRIAKLDPVTKAAEIAVVKDDKAAFEREIARIEDGVDLIRKHTTLRKCFQWMNEAMDQAIRLQGKPFDGWHLFQLGFVLTQIRAIYERHALDTELERSADVADVLWFATGSGKTEAYLGIIAMAMLYARAMQRTYGTTAWMRFPLRMLSVQQFQRLSYVVAQANIIRQRECLQGYPLTIGYFTGRGTPGRISSSGVDNYARDFLPNLSETQLKAYQFISDCPYCGIGQSVHLVRDYSRARLQHVCRNPECWSNTEAESGAHGEGIRGEIGIFVSDEECYRFLPTVMVGTIDKLAVIAHNTRFAGFFGAAKHFCPEHGFIRDPKCSHNRIVKTSEGYESKPCGNNSRTSEIRTHSVPTMLDPGFSLLIQDELHLLRESLGNFDAHYETLLAALQIAHGGRTPKILAATATIKDFEAHIHNLYLKGAVRFPAPGATRGESFYVRRIVDKSSGNSLIRRWFAGVLPIGRGNAAMRAVAEISSRFLDQVDEWRTKLRDADPSLIGAIGLDALQAAPALAYVEHYLNTDLVYANRRRNIPEVLRFMEEANGQRGVARHHFQLDGESTLDEILLAIQHIERKHAEDPRRHIIATSVVSHGVDIIELNFMVLAGWPASTAEYIQASARSGRVHPGIIISVLSPNKLFETNVFLNFQDYHFFIERLVESVPINRFAPNVLDRTLPGIMAAVLLNWAPHAGVWGRDLDRNMKSLFKVLAAPGGNCRNEILAVVMRALEVPRHLAPAFDVRVLNDFNNSLEDKVRHALHRLEHWSAGKMDQTITQALGDIFGHEPMRSFRDIENQIQVKPVSEAAEQILDALAR